MIDEQKRHLKVRRESEKEPHSLKRIIMFTFLIGCVFFLSLILYVIHTPFFVAAQPMADFSDYSGTIYINGEKAERGTVIEIKTGAGVSCGKQDVLEKGVFGPISCYQSRLIINNTLVVTPKKGENLSWYINGRRAIVIGDKSWAAGKRAKIKLVESVQIIKNRVAKEKGAKKPSKSESLRSDKKRDYDGSSGKVLIDNADESFIGVENESHFMVYVLISFIIIICLVFASYWFIIKKNS